MSTENAGRERILARLRELLLEVWDEHPRDEPVDGHASLLSLGVDSLTLVSLLDKLETEFHLRWDPDDPPGAHSSLHSLADAALATSP